MPFSIAGWPLWLLCPWLWFFLATVPLTSDAQRLKQGCFDAFPEDLRCGIKRFLPPEPPDPAALVTASGASFSIEQVCLWLSLEVFPFSPDFLNTSKHPEHLNTLESSSEECQKAKIAYPHCLFCSSSKRPPRESFDPSLYYTFGIGLFFQCGIDADITTCGGKLSREDAVMNQNPPYHRLQSDQDIDRTCQELQTTLVDTPRSVIPGLGHNLPASQDLCIRQHLVAHLCPENCQGGCLDEVRYPPTCSREFNPAEWGDAVETFYKRGGPLGVVIPENESRPPLPTGYLGINYSDPVSVCLELRALLFGDFTTLETTLNTSQHLDYFNSIDEESQWCPLARQAYSSCAWCAPNLCFDPRQGPSCRPPSIENGNPQNLNSTNMIELVLTQQNYSFGELEEICRLLFQSVVDTSGVEGFRSMVLAEENWLCDAAKEVLYLCPQSCRPDPKIAPPNFCAGPNHCETRHTTVLPGNFQSYTLEVLGIEDPTATGIASEDCAIIHQTWNRTRTIRWSYFGCFEDIYLSNLCPNEFCPEGRDTAEKDFAYLGATTEGQKKALIWTARVSAILSFLGASYILFDVLTDPKTRQMVYHQLLVGMATFDMVTAIAWSFATIPIDADKADYIQQASGNSASCTAQAFFVQLGVTSIFYSTSLAVYYVLVIVYSWREFQLVKIRKYLQGVPLVCGIGLALGGLPVYNVMGYACHVEPLPDGEVWVVLVFVVLPLGLSITAITCCLLKVYCNVRQRATSSAQWSISGSANTLEKQVFWQCISYMLAFYISWPILFSVYLFSVDVNGPLGLTLIVAFLAPLQGFMNALVYLRPKLFNVSKRNSASSRQSSFAAILRKSLGRRRESSSQNPRDLLDPSAQIALQNHLPHEAATENPSPDYKNEVIGERDTNYDAEQKVETDGVEHCKFGKNDDPKDYLSVSPFLPVAQMHDEEGENDETDVQDPSPNGSAQGLLPVQEVEEETKEETLQPHHFEEDAA
ncbi:expressed unknown protein [Seminavis robusta]|uniref:G-protein coupled receptors family 2 profile 2 domain-containing protein n=1 Tax=Seminavis robusta TaxID=568900 RepID=A0A9N8DLE6_9STRA|nr:expressed unknown protein [Seminavis robusta]|eukprot:Sro209_g087330.1 n/a (984) ;mRNA; r:38667-41618